MYGRKEIESEGHDLHSQTFPHSSLGFLKTPNVDLKTSSQTHNPSMEHRPIEKTLKLNIQD